MAAPLSFHAKTHFGLYFMGQYHGQSNDFQVMGMSSNGAGTVCILFYSQSFMQIAKVILGIFLVKKFIQDPKAAKNDMAQQGPCSTDSVGSQEPVSFQRFIYKCMLGTKNF